MLEVLFFAGAANQQSRWYRCAVTADMEASQLALYTARPRLQEAVIFLREIQKITPVGGYCKSNLNRVGELKE